MSNAVWVGVFRGTLSVPGARSRKDRRQVVRSVRDRVRHRFDLTFREISEVQRPLGVVMALSTVGSDPTVVRAALDKVRCYVDDDPRCVLGSADLDVFRWEPSAQGWIAALGIDVEGEPDE